MTNSYESDTKTFFSFIPKKDVWCIMCYELHLREAVSRKWTVTCMKVFLHSQDKGYIIINDSLYLCSMAGYITSYRQGPCYKIH